MEIINLAFSIFLFAITYIVIVYAYFFTYSFVLGLKIKKLKKQNVMTRLMNGDHTVRICELPNFALPKVQIDFWKNKYYDLVKYNNQSLIEKNEVILLQNSKIKALETKEIELSLLDIDKLYVSEVIHNVYSFEATFKSEIIDCITDCISVDDFKKRAIDTFKEYHRLHKNIEIKYKSK